VHDGTVSNEKDGYVRLLTGRATLLGDSGQLILNSGEFVKSSGALSDSGGHLGAPLLSGSPRNGFRSLLLKIPLIFPRSYDTSYMDGGMMLVITYGPTNEC
jgi:hypothetical protein